MEFSFTQIPYRQTGFFSRLMEDYLDCSPVLTDFYEHPVSPEGFSRAIQNRMQHPVNRQLLLEALQSQYNAVEPDPAVSAQIKKLSQPNCFTVCTAHQPALFTGTLFFIYKILHTIRLSRYLKKEYPQHEFVPVFWMGSEDADLEELGHINLGNEKLVWNTSQAGAFGKMKPKGLNTLLDRISGELSVQPFGKQLVELLRDCYLNSPDIQTATFRLLHILFGKYGLVILIPDTGPLKRLLLPVMEDDIFHERASALVEPVIEKLGEWYKIQANPRAINVFYMGEGFRERIVKKGEQYAVHNTKLVFSKESLQTELNSHPEKFSPNVILRGLYQETILPNLAFIGGGGETAYWLEFRELFRHYKVPFPVLVLRNSFLLVEKKWKEKMEKIGFITTDFFQSEQQLLSRLLMRKSNGALHLQQEILSTSELFRQIKDKAANTDPTLAQHVQALEAKTVKPLQELEKKMMRAAKKRFEAEQRQIQTIRDALFPKGGLQERMDNILPWYARFGPAFIDLLLENSLNLEQQFGILTEK